MILFTNGCSWTCGGGLELNGKKFDKLRNQVVWPKYLGDLMNVEDTINMAAICGSNQRIVRTTFEWFHKNFDPNKSYTAIIQWTELSRYEYYVTDNPFTDFTNDSDCWARAKPGVVWTTKEDPKRALKTSERRLQTYTSIEGNYNHLRDCAALAYLFDNLGVRYYFWNYHDNLINSEFSGYFKQFNYIDASTWEYERVSTSDTHPSFKGHRELAQLLYDSLNR